MARTNQSAVEAAIDTSLDGVAVVSFIDDASLWVDENLTDDGLSDDLLTAIEKYLACHFITLRDPRLRSATLADVAETYQRDTEVTEYLKSAAALDPTGKVEDQFIASEGRSRVRFRVGTGYAS